MSGSRRRATLADSRARPLLRSGFAVVLLGALAGCGAATAGPNTEPAPRPKAAVEALAPPVTQDAGVHAPRSETFVASPDAVWAALGRAYASVGLKVNGVDTVTRTMGFAGIIRRNLKGTRLSTFFDCGAQMGANADSYDITLYVASQVASNPQTRNILVTTGLRVSGQNPAFASTKSACTTKGELERRIMDAIKKEVKE
jgi:hypothetical protein